MRSPRAVVRAAFCVALVQWTTVSLLVGSLQAGNPELLSPRDSAIAAPMLGTGHSVAPTLSTAGRYILFSSAANNLVTNDNGEFGLDAFLHDRMTDTTVLASPNAAGTGGGDADSVGLQVSANGRYVLLESDASNLIAGDTNATTDILVRDLELQTYSLVSVAENGGFGNGASFDAVMSPDGRWVAFVSEATNLVAGDTNDLPDLFLRDLLLGTTTGVTAGSTGSTAVVSSPVITPFGRFIAFVSTAKGLVAGVPTGNREEVYLYDAVLDEMSWVSTNAAVVAQSLLDLLNAPSFRPALSDDGRYVSYKTGWTNGTQNVSPGNEATIVFAHDSVLNATAIVTTNGFPPRAHQDDVYGPVMTADGRYIAYVEREGAGTDTATSVRLWDRVTGTNVIVSVDRSDLFPTNTASHTPGVSDDGRYVTFLSDATNMVESLTADGYHIYRRDLLLGLNELVDVDTGGTGSGDQLGVIPSTSGDGSRVVYAALDGNLVNGDSNKWLDVLLWNAAYGSNTLISARDPLAPGVSGNKASSLGRLSLSDVGTAAFASYAGDLVTNDFNQDADVFVRDLVGGSNLLVSVGLDGHTGSGGGSFDPILSKDGRYVIFVSWATNLTADDTDNSSDIFKRDLLTGTTTLVSTNYDYTGIYGPVLDCGTPLASDDGRFVAWIGYPSSSSSSRALLRRDLTTGITRVVGTDPNPDLSVSMSADGQRLAYFDGADPFYTWDLLYVWDVQTNAVIYENSSFDLTSAAISPLGNRLLFTDETDLHVRDLPGTSDQQLYPSDVPIKGSAQWSGDGRCLAFVTGTALVTADANGATDVYLYDLQTETLTLLSVNETGMASASGDSDSPVFSRDGRFVAFRSTGLDIAPGLTVRPSLVLFDRETGSNRLVVAGTADTGPFSWLAQPVLSTNGAWMAFQSWDSGVVESDLNRAGDAFGGVVDAPALTDTDGDGIPDWWTMQYFGHPTGEVGDLSRAEDDADLDGLTNLEEFEIGTNPVNPNSRLAAEIDPSATPGWMVLHWEAKAGRGYRVQSSQSTKNPVWQTVEGQINVIGNQGQLDIQSLGDVRFFRVEGSQKE